MGDDHDLLRRYGAHAPDAQAAFTSLVQRHIDLVYSVALRIVRSPPIAEDVAQSVFLDLARQSARVPSDAPLVAWLHVVTRRAAIDAVRQDARRRARESAAATLADASPASAPWSDIEPLLDEAVESLPAQDRTAILLRFFENKSLRDIGAALGTSDDAAQKRVARAVDHLRGFFSRRGIAVPAAGLASTLSAHAFHAAPAGLGSAISSAVALSAPVGVAAVETARVIAMTTLQKSAVVAAFVAAGSFGLYEATLVARTADELTATRREVARTASDVHALRTAQNASATRLKSIEAELDRRLAQAAAKSPADVALEQQMHEWLERMDTVHQFLARRPEFNIPELQLLPRETWFELAGGKTFTTDEEFRRITSQLRDRAEGLVAARLSSALRAYVRAHADMLPATLADLLPLCDPPLDPAILGRYTLLQTGKLAEVPPRERSKIISVTAPVDAEFDRLPTIGTTGYGGSGAIYQNVSTAIEAYVAAHSGQRPATAAQLKPFLRWPLSEEAAQRTLDEFARRRP